MYDRVRAKRLGYLASLAALSLTVVACGGGGTGNGGEEEQASQAASGEQLLSGAIEVDGSSTVFPISEAMAEEFQNQYPDTRVTVGVSGTGGGFEKFCGGETDISNASRPIKQEEIEACEEAGISFIELPVAYDAVSVLVNPSNDWAECLSVDQLRTVWEPDAQGQIDNWNQIDPEFPDQSLSLYGPGTDSGTFDYFTDAIVGEEGASRGDYTASEDDNVIITGVTSDPGALGYVGLAYYEENADSLKAVAIDDGDANNGDGCVSPSAATVEDGTYQPLARPIFIYVSQAAVEEKPQVQEFVNYYLDSNNRNLIGEVGYVPLSDPLYQKAQTRLESRKTGTAFPDGSTVGVKLDDVL